jgi:hypothetical protein
LFAALNIATGQVTGVCKPRHREFSGVPQTPRTGLPDQELRLVMDNYAAYTQEVLDWLDANPCIRVHFTPTSASRMNMVETWFDIIERQAIHRGTFGSVGALTTTIRSYINGWNNRAHPFAWTKTPTRSSRTPIAQTQGH